LVVSRARQSDGHFGWHTSSRGDENVIPGNQSEEEDQLLTRLRTREKESPLLPNPRADLPASRYSISYCSSSRYWTRTGVPGPGRGLPLLSSEHHCSCLTISRPSGVRKEYVRETT